MNPIKVFLDTNIFDAASYSFNSGVFEKLIKYIERGEVELWLSDITIREAKRHIESGIRQTINTLKKDNKVINILRSSVKYNKFFELTEKRLMVYSALKEFDNFLRKTKAKVLNSKGIKSDKIIDDYFAEKPPFCGAGKKSEFPDAFMIAKVRSILPKMDEIHIVSNDGCWEQAFAGEKKVTTYLALKDFLGCLNRKSAVQDKIVEYLRDASNHKSIKEDIISLLNETVFSVEGRDYDRKGMYDGYEYDDVINQNASNVILKKAMLEYIDKSLYDENQKVHGTVTLRLECTADIDVECTFFDEANSVWDSEDKEYILRAEGTANESHQIEFDVELEFDVSKSDEEYLFKQNGIQLDGLRLNLDSETLVSERNYRMQDHFEEWDRGFEVKRKYTCPQCKASFSVELMNEAEFVSSSERPMGTENQYEIAHEAECPSCGKSYKIMGTICEYPVLALNYDDTEIKW